MASREGQAKFWGIERKTATRHPEQAVRHWTQFTEELRVGSDAPALISAVEVTAAAEE